MSFANPIFLLGLFALAIPIIVHLFNFRRAKVVYFSNTRMLRDIKQQTKKTRKIKHLLTLISRLLFVLFIVLAFAKPYIPTGKATTQSDQVFIYLDNSYSMSNQGNDGTLFAQAISYLENIASEYPPNTPFQLITNEFGGNVNQTLNRRQLTDKSTELSLTNVPRSAHDVLEKISSKKDGSRKDIYFISDFQESTFGEEATRAIDSADQLFLIPVAPLKSDNVFVDSVYLENPFMVSQQKNRLFVRVINAGESAVDNLLVKLFVNDIHSSGTSVDIAPGASSIITFELTFRLEKQNTCKISFEDFPVSFDNEFYFTLNIEEPIKIVEISGVKSPTPVSQVYGNNELFDFTSYQQDNINYADIESSDVLVLYQPTNINSALMSQLSQFLKGEKPIILFPKDRNTSFASLVQSGVVSPLTDSVPTQLQMPDLNAPFFENIFENTRENFEMPFGVPAFRIGGQSVSLLQYKNGLPFLSAVGQKLYLVNTLPKEANTNFDKHALFVPVMYKLALEGKKQTNRLYYSVASQVIGLNINEPNAGSIYKLVRGDEELIPDQRVVNSRLIIHTPRFTLSPGFYTLMDENVQKATLAINSDRAESMLSVNNPETIKELFGALPNVTILETDNAIELKKELKVFKSGIQLWKYAVILALIFLLAEILIIRLVKL